MRRRALLTGAAAVAGAGLFMPDRASAGWGTLNPRTNPWGPNASNRPISRILEVFVYGGLSPWETFYLNPATAGDAAACSPASTCPGSPDPQNIMQWGTFKCQFEALARSDTRRATDTAMTKEVIPNVHLGPPTYPLWRADLFNHLQVLVCNHDLLPHEAAIPYALTGTRLGRPTLAGTGAFAARYFQANQVPVSFVVQAGGATVGDNLAAATATGDLGSEYKPMLITVPCGGPDLSVLTRQATPAQDLLLKYYVEDYRARLTFPGKTVATRSSAFSGFDATLGQFFNTQQIQALLGSYDPNDNQLIRGEEPGCVKGGGGRCPGAAETDGVRQSLNFAAFLLKQETTRYVCVIDTGRQNEAGAGYDTHANNAQGTYRSLSSTLEVIARLTDPNQPGGPKIDPFTMIVINTEFGRTPNKEGNGDGRAHYPYAYANLIIPPAATGPAFPFRPQRRVLGGIDQNGRVQAQGGSTIAAITPTDLRAAMLMALGIDPLAKPDGGSLGSAFGVGDLSEGMQSATENGVRANLVREVLGYDV
jgi:hypothetical protein